jgi:hypothetical protein
MFLGADVSHPPPGSLLNRPSLATMTGSLDLKATRYAAMAMNQGHRVEMIQDAHRMTSALLKQFVNATRRLPEQIIYLRDGVSDGQFSQVIETELPAIRKAADEVTNNKRLKITVIIVKKRHHTRFFPLPTGGGHAGGGRDAGNVKPGTVVDTAVVHPIEFDFCTFSSFCLIVVLVSHKSYQGTCRPAHYRISSDIVNLT